MTTSPLPARSRARHLAVGFAATAASFAVATAVGSHPADAVSGVPAAEVGFQCASYVGGQSWASISNAEGLAPRTFTIVRTGLPPLVMVLPAGGSNTIYTAVAEHSTFDISVTPEGGATVSNHQEDVDCFEYTGTITLSCDGDQPMLTATATRTGSISTYVTFSDGTGTQSDAGNDLAFTSAIAEDQPFSASLATDQDGVFATLTGTPDCADGTPTTTTSTTTSTTSTTLPATTTSTTTTVPGTTSTLPDPPTPVTSTTIADTSPPEVQPTDEVTSTTAARPLAAGITGEPGRLVPATDRPDLGPLTDEVGPTTLPRTGSDTGGLALAGTALLAGGSLLLRRSTARR